LDLNASGAWENRSGRLYKGNIPITDNERVASELFRYLPPGSSVSFKAGFLSESESAKLRRLDDSSTFLHLLFSISELDPRFRRMMPSTHGPNVGKDVPPLGFGSFNGSIYLVPNGMVIKLFGSGGENVGWMRLQVGPLEQSSMENWIFTVSFIGIGILACIILAILYIILFRLTVPILHLAESHSAMAQKNEDLKSLTQSDPLTGLLNRRGFQAARADKLRIFNASSHALAILDLDDFKKINDSYGHSCGDFVLVQVAAVIQKTIRRQDLACRWGGEEFLICYPDISSDIVEEATERLRVSINALSANYEGVEISVAVTIGTALCRDEADFEEALGRADAALYQGKRAGKNRVVSFSV